MVRWLFEILEEYYISKDKKYNDGDGMWIPLFSYPKDKFLIKKSVEELLECEGNNLQEYIKYLVKMNELSTLRTIEEYFEDFGMTGKEKEKLSSEIVMLKLTSQNL